MHADFHDSLSDLEIAAEMLLDTLRQANGRRATIDLTDTIHLADEGRDRTAGDARAG